MRPDRLSGIWARVAVVVGMSLAVMSHAAIAQDAPAPAPAQPPAAAPAAPPPTTEPPYSYDPQGRRDPFVSLSSGISDLAGAGRRGEGLAGVTTAEIVVTGVMQSRGAYVALTHGPDMKTYIVRVKDRLADGTVSSITPQGMVVLQEVSDRLSAVKLREVHKGLRDSEDAK